MLSGHGWGQLVLGGLAWVRRVDQGPPEVPSKPSRAVLWLYENCMNQSGLLHHSLKLQSVSFRFESIGKKEKQHVIPMTNAVGKYTF